MVWTSKEQRRKHYLKHRDQILAKNKALGEVERKKRNQNALKYYYLHREERLAYAERINSRIIHSSKTTLRNVDKPPKPSCCTICKRQSHLVFHHWVDETPEIGLWTCNRCHHMIHRMIRVGLIIASTASQELFI